MYTKFGADSSRYFLLERGQSNKQTYIHTYRRDWTHYPRRRLYSRCN